MLYFNLLCFCATSGLLECQRIFDDVIVFPSSDFASRFGIESIVVLAELNYCYISDKLKEFIRRYV